MITPRRVWKMRSTCCYLNILQIVAFGQKLRSWHMNTETQQCRTSETGEEKNYWTRINEIFYCKFASREVFWLEIDLIAVYCLGLLLRINLIVFLPTLLLFRVWILRQNLWQPNSLEKKNGISLPISAFTSIANSNNISFHFRLNQVDLRFSFTLSLALALVQNNAFYNRNFQSSK